MCSKSLVVRRLTYRQCSIRFFSHAARLCEAERGLLLNAMATPFTGSVSTALLGRVLRVRQGRPVEPGRRHHHGRVSLEGKVDPRRRPPGRSRVHLDGATDVRRFRTILGVPMFRGNDLVGVFSLYAHVVRPFTDKQIELVATFADQAVIAIENVRLFESVDSSHPRIGEVTGRLADGAGPLGPDTKSWPRSVN